MAGKGGSIFRWFCRGLLGLAGIGIAYGLYVGVLMWSGNFHEVVPGELYRAAQPSEERIAGYKERYGIKTIINLRGENRGRDWYDKAKAESEKLGIAYVDFRMSARRPLTQEQARELVGLFTAAEKPILIHCQGGADRSGLASALYMAAVAKQGEEVAERQLSLRFGHLGIPFLFPSSAMDDAFEVLEPWLGYKNS